MKNLMGKTRGVAVCSRISAVAPCAAVGRPKWRLDDGVGPGAAEKKSPFIRDLNSPVGAFRLFEFQ